MAETGLSSGLASVGNSTTLLSGSTAGSNFMPGGGGLSAGGYTSAIGSILQLGTSIYGGYLQKQVYKANANLAQAQGNYESSVAEYNAAVARANALAIRTVADLDIERQKKAATTFKSGQIAGYSKAGVKLEGSPLLVMIDSAQQAKLDIAITDYNAKIGVQQAQSRGEQFDISGQLAKSGASSLSKMYSSAGDNAFRQGIAKGLGQSTSLLSTVSSYSR